MCSLIQLAGRIHRVPWPTGSLFPRPSPLSRSTSSVFPLAFALSTRPTGSLFPRPSPHSRLPSFHSHRLPLSTWPTVTTPTCNVPLLLASPHAAWPLPFAFDLFPLANGIYLSPLKFGLFPLAFASPHFPLFHSSSRQLRPYLLQYLKGSKQQKL